MERNYVTVTPFIVILVSGVRRMNEVNARRARLILTWATVFGGYT